MKKWDLLYSAVGVNDFVLERADDDEYCEITVHFWLRVGGKLKYYWSPLRRGWINLSINPLYMSATDSRDFRGLIVKLLVQTISGGAVEVQPLSFLLSTGLDLYDTFPKELR